MANCWFRLWHDMPNDPKWRTIARAAKQPIPLVISVYLHVLVNASANEVKRGSTLNLVSEDIASSLDASIEDVDAVLKAMEGRVLDGGNVTGWDKRQPIRERGDQEAAARAKAWRDGKKRTSDHHANASERQRTPANANERLDKDKEKEEEKEQDDELLPEMVTRAVMDRCRLAGMGLSVVLDQIVRIHAQRGVSLNALTDRMVAAWDEFQAAKPKLKYFSGAEKFFGEGIWENRNLWPWKDGMRPDDAKPKRIYAGENA